MRTWRIAEEDVALDRSCEGARKSGGHWHNEGCPALYTAMTAEMAVLEKFVHTDSDQRDLVKCHHLYMRVPSVIVGGGGE